MGWGRGWEGWWVLQWGLMGPGTQSWGRGRDQQAAGVLPLVSHRLTAACACRITAGRQQHAGAGHETFLLWEGGPQYAGRAAHTSSRLGREQARQLLSPLRCLLVCWRSSCPVAPAPLFLLQAQGCERQVPAAAQRWGWGRGQAGGPGVMAVLHATRADRARASQPSPRPPAARTVPPQPTTSAWTTTGGKPWPARATAGLRALSLLVT